MITHQKLVPVSCKFQYFYESPLVLHLFVACLLITTQNPMSTTKNIISTTEKTTSKVQETTSTTQETSTTEGTTVASS